MAIELITGRAGTPHVDSSDMRELYSSIVGRDRYLLNDHGTGVAEMQSANDCRLMPAELLVDGAHVRITGDGETVSIDNGSSSYDRVDVVALHYTSTGDSGSRVESISVEVVKGTPVDTGGEAKDPDMPSGSATILDGSTDVYIPYVRIKLVGLTPQDPESMLPTVPKSLYEAGTAVWPIANGGTGATTVDGALAGLGVNLLLASGGTAKVHVGSKIIRGNGSTWQILWTPAEFKEAFGRVFNNAKDFCAVMNAEQAAFNASFYSASWHGTNGMVVAYQTNASTSQILRVNYLIVMVD